jgi:peroxin-16
LAGAWSSSFSSSSSPSSSSASAADRALALEARVAAVGAAGVRLGEALHLLRPLLYVLLLRKHGPRSWRPWLASLAIELASGLATRKGHGLAAEARAQAALGGRAWPPPRTSLRSLALLSALASPRWRPAESAELLGRRFALLRYLLRSPAYERATRPCLAAVARGARWLPLAAPATRFALELVDGMQGYYTYVEG